MVQIGAFTDAESVPDPLEPESSSALAATNLASNDLSHGRLVCYCCPDAMSLAARKNNGSIDDEV